MARQVANSGDPCRRRVGEVTSRGGGGREVDLSLTRRLLIPSSFRRLLVRTCRTHTAYCTWVRCPQRTPDS